MGKKLAVFMCILLLGLGIGIPGLRASEADELVIVKPFGPSARIPDPAKGSEGWYTSEAGVTETLFTLGFDMKLRPWLAESAVNAGPLLWEIRLKKGILFHDNSAVTASDVRRVFERLTDEKSDVFNPRVQSLLDLKSVRVRDEYTLIFETRQPNAAFLYDLTSPDTAIVRPGDEGICGTGPFALEKVVPGEEMVVSRFEKYWGGRPKLAKAHLKVVKNPATRMLAFEAGQADVAVNFPEYDAARLQDRKDMKIVQSPTARLCFFFVRTADGPLADIRIRKAVSCAINRQEIVDAVLAGIGGKAGASLFPDVLPWNHRGLKLSPYDPKKALQLLAEAGAADTDGDGVAEFKGQPLVLNMWTYEGRASLKPALELVQVQLGKVGIGARLRVTQKGSPINQGMKKGQVHLNLQMWNAAPQGDPDFFISNVLTTNAGSNFMGYSNPELDALARKGKSCFDPAERKKIYDRIQEIVYDECPLIVLFHKTMLSAVKGNVGNYRIHPAEKYILNPEIGKAVKAEDAGS